MKPRVLIPVALGTNRDHDLSVAFELAGADALAVPLSALRSGEVSLEDFQILAVPGGFSYGDALGAGRLLGLDLQSWFNDQLKAAVSAGKPVFGVCNGFQALVRAGLLPGSSADPGTSSKTVLTENTSGRFECRWVTLAAASSNSVWTTALTDPIRCPVAHGEGQFVSSDLARLEANDQVVLRYVKPDGSAAQGSYPTNPNGSAGDVAGICDESGLVLGLMPHPENHVLARQDPQRGRRNTGGDKNGSSGICLPLFASGVAAVS